MPTTWNAIFLGRDTALQLDPTEGAANPLAENARLLVNRTFGTSDNPLRNQVHRLETQDSGGTGNTATAMDNNNSVAQDRYLTDLNRDGTSETYIHDTAVYYTTTITYQDGTSPAQPIVARIVQTTTGELFLAPPPAASTADIAALTAKPIQSITIGQPTTGAPALPGQPAQQSTVLVRDRPDLAFVACFAAGTAIRTPSGDVPVEDLAAGDLVQTVDAGAQPIRWIGITTIDLAKAPHLAPIRIAAGALGAGQPAADLLVSPQHRVLVRSRIAQRMFGAQEVLVAAKLLLDLPGFSIADDLAQVDYAHFMFDAHQVVWSNGALTESLFTGPEALKAVGPAARDEIMVLMPDLAQGAPDPVRPLVAGRTARRLALRHAGNAQQLIAH